METSAIVTMPPYAPYMAEVLRHSIVSGIRLNTVMPVKDSLEDVLKRLSDEAAMHGKESATVAAVNGNKLIMLEGPKRVVGPGEAVNIPHHSLQIEGNLTDTDKGYIEAAVKTGMHSYMLSFVESQNDVEELKKLDSAAKVVAKIESRKGLEYVANDWKGEPRLMAARGDLFIELQMPHHIIPALEAILAKDKTAIAASRIFPSLAYSLEPASQDIGDADNLLRMGYRTLMFGDDVCMQRDSIISGLNLLKAMAARYEK